MAIPLRPLWLFFVIIFGLFNHLKAQTITTGTVSPNPVCAGTQLTVPFTTSGTFASGNQFQAEIASAGGSFTALTGTQTSGNQIVATIPANLSGTGYQVRVSGVSSATTIIGSISSGTFTITAPPSTAPTVGTAGPFCQGSTATPLSATATSTNTLRWRGPNIVGFQTSAPTPPTTTTGILSYTVTQVTAGSSCESPAATISVSITAKPSAPGTSNLTYCQSTPASSLTAIATGTLSWSTSTGTPISGTALIPSTGSAGVTTYRVTQTVSGCTSDVSTLDVNVIGNPAAPSVTSPVAYCQGAFASALQASATSGNSLAWYGQSASGGTPSPVAPTPSTTTPGSFTFYVAQTTNTGNCIGPRSPIIVTINAKPADPTVQGAVSYCQNVTAAPLSATATSGNALRWYANTITNTSTASLTPSTTSTGSTTYYVSQYNTTTGCESDRVGVTVTVNGYPAAPTAPSSFTFCLNQTSPGTISATPSGGGTLNWYTVASSGTGSPTTPTLSFTAVGTTTYYVTQIVNGCESATRTAINAVVRPLPSAPSVPSSLTYCQSIPVISTALSATASSGGTLNWYDTNQTGGSASSTAPIPSIATSGNTNYYVSQTVNGCEGPRASIPVTVRPQPATPTVASSLTLCQNDTPVALATGVTAPTGSGVILNWYTANTGTTAPSSLTPATTTAFSATYFVSQTDVNGCESNRASLAFRVKTRPAAPGITALEYCQAQTNIPALTATVVSGNQTNWYGTNQTGGTASTTAPVPPSTTPGTTVYYVSQTQEGCEGPRAGLSVLIKPLPAAPGVTEYNVCQFAPAQPLTANGQNLKWFNTWGEPFPANFTPVPSTDGSQPIVYQVSQTVNGCEGPKANLTVNILITPPPIVKSPVIYCQNTTAQPLSATAVPGGSLIWTDPYGRVTDTPPLPPTLNVTEGVDYLVAQSAPNGCKSVNAIIRYIVNGPPTASLSGPSSINLGQSANLSLTFTSVPPFSYTLSDGTSGTSNALQQTILVTPTQSTIYRVTSVSNVCGSGIPVNTVNLNVRTPTITTGVLPAGTVCAGAQLPISFQTTGEFNIGNTFRVQMALDTSFTNPIDISPLQSQTGNIIATVPITAAQGIYYVRVLASNPSIPVPGRRSPTTLDVRALPVATLTGTKDIFEGESTQLSIQLTGTGPWQLQYADSLRTIAITTNANPHVITVTPPRTTTYRLVSVSNSCGEGTVAGTARIRVLPVLGLEPNPLNNGLKVYPTPVAQTLTVDISLDLKQQPALLRLQDASGRITLQTTTRQQQTPLDVSNHPPGLYYLHVQVGDYSTVRKVLKQ